MNPEEDFQAANQPTMRRLRNKRLLKDTAIRRHNFQHLGKAVKLVAAGVQSKHNDKTLASGFTWMILKKTLNNDHLQISMRNTLAVTIINSIHELLKIFTRVVFVKPSLMHLRSKKGSYNDHFYCAKEHAYLHSDS